MGNYANVGPYPLYGVDFGTNEFGNKFIKIYGRSMFKNLFSWNSGKASPFYMQARLFGLCDERYEKFCANFNLPRNNRETELYDRLIPENALIRFAGVVHQIISTPLGTDTVEQARGYYHRYDSSNNYFYTIEFTYRPTKDQSKILGICSDVLTTTVEQYKYKVRDLYENGAGDRVIEYRILEALNILKLLPLLGGKDCISFEDENHPCRQIVAKIWSSYTEEPNGNTRLVTLNDAAKIQSKVLRDGLIRQAKQLLKNLKVSSPDEASMEFTALSTSGGQCHYMPDISSKEPVEAKLKINRGGEGEKDETYHIIDTSFGVGPKFGMYREAPNLKRFDARYLALKKEREIAKKNKITNPELDQKGRKLAAERAAEFEKFTYLTLPYAQTALNVKT